MSLFKPSYCFLPIYHASLPKLEIPAFHSLFLRLARAADAKKIVWSPEALLKILEQMPICFQYFIAKRLNFSCESSAQQTIHM